MSDNKKNEDTNKDNIISLADKKSEKETRLKQEVKANKNSEPLVNLPPVTRNLIALMMGVFLIFEFILSSTQQEWAFFNLGFMPAKFTGDAHFDPLATLTPFTNLFLHAGWLHVIMNTVMLLAFGSGVERWMGGRKMVALFIATGLFGVALHFALNPSSLSPVVGASGGISGLFAAALIMLNQRNQGMTGRFGLWPIIIVWVGISVLFGVIGDPQSGLEPGQIAWAAHVGGFLGGFAILKLMKLF